jgi:hypothetical protein
MDEGAGAVAYDQSGYSNAGTLGGTTKPVWTDGKMGEALNFDGTNNTGGFVDAGNKSVLQPATAITISAWIKPLGTDGGYQAIVAKDNLSVAYWFGLDSLTPYFILTSDGFTQSNATTSASLSIGTWYHLVAAYNGTDQRIYINGILNSNGGSNPKAHTGVIYSNSSRLLIGKSDAWSGNEFNGLIDEARIYNRALSATEVGRLYNLTRPKFKAASSQGLVDYWPMDEGSGTIVGDMSGRGNNGTLNGTALPIWIDGKKGKALNFDGINSEVIVGEVGIKNYQPFSVSAWVKRDGAGAYTIACTNADGAGNIGKFFWLFYVADGGVVFQFGKVWNGNFYFATDASLVPDNQWAYIVATWDGYAIPGHATVYINGQSKSLSFGTSGDYASPSDSDSVTIGNRAIAPWPFKGSIDEVRIYDHMLSATEVANLYTSSNKIFKVSTSQNNKVTTGLVGMWSFNGPDISGTTVFDRGSGGNNGMLVGSPALTIGKVGQAIDLNGSAQRVYVGSPVNLDNISTFTYSIWAKAEGEHNNGYGPLITKANGSTERKIFQFYQYNPGSNMGKVGMKIVASTTNASSVAVTGTYRWNEWAFWAATYDDGGDRIARIYKNGSEVTYETQQAAVGPLTSDASEYFVIGGMAPAGFYSFNGVLDEVRIYNRVLTASEIQRLYNMGK